MKAAVQIAVKWSRDLDAMDKKDRETVLNILWFYYIGRFMKWKPR